MITNIQTAQILIKTILTLTTNETLLQGQSENCSICNTPIINWKAEVKINTNETKIFYTDKPSYIELFRQEKVIGSSLLYMTNRINSDYSVGRFYTHPLNQKQKYSITTNNSTIIFE